MTKGDETRNAILTEATAVAAKVGLTGMTIGQLAAHTGMSKSGLYAHFASKEALQIEILRHTRERFVDQVVRPALQSPRGVARLRVLFDAWVTWSEACEDGGCLFVAACSELDDQPGPVRDALVRDERDWLEMIATVAGTAVSEGEFRARPRPRAVRVRAARPDPRPPARLATAARPQGPRSRASRVRLAHHPRRPAGLNQQGIRHGIIRIQKSTTVRPSQRLMQAAFRTLEHTVPSLGARWADRLWFTLPTSPVTDLPPGGTAFEVESQGHTVRGHRWGAGPVIYLVHGWGGNETQLARFVPPLVAAGFSVVTHDAPSHGTSDPGAVAGQGHAVEMGHALDAVAAVHGPAHAVVAHSMGGLATGLTLRYGWLGTERLALVAPMVRIGDHLPVLAAQLGFGPRIRARLERRAHRRVGLAVDEVDFVRIADEIERPELPGHP